jgi:hypothetical protein
METTNKALEQIRRELEITNCCQGFQITHSTQGGTGSGMTMSIFENLQDLFNGSKNAKNGGIWFYSVFPSTEISNTTTAPYNTALSLQAMENAKNVT